MAWIAILFSDGVIGIYFVMLGILVERIRRRMWRAWCGRFDSSGYFYLGPRIEAWRERFDVWRGRDIKVRDDAWWKERARNVKPRDADWWKERARADWEDQE